MRAVKVWDWPVRICHWSIVGIVVFQFASGKFLDDTLLNNNMQYHFYAGYACIGIIIFRISWGFCGTYYAKFSQFLVSPKKAWAYVNKVPMHSQDKATGRQMLIDSLGHNPAGAYSIIALLSLLLTQALSGLFISDEIFTDGPYYGVLGAQWQAIMNFLHANAINALLIFIALHIGAIVFYKFKKQQHLTLAMLSGYKKVKNDDFEEIQANFPWLAFIICLLITAASLYLLIEVWPPEPADDYFGY